MSSIRKIFILAAGVAALGAASVSTAGVSSQVMQQIQERNAGNQSSPPPAAPAPAAAPSYSPPPAQRSSEPSINFRNQQPNTRAERSAPPPQQSAAPRPQQQDRSASRPDNDRNASSNSRGGRGVIGNVIERRFPDRAPGNGNGNGNGNGGGHNNHGDHDHDGHSHRPPRTVYVLPPSYYDYYWNGSRYYNFDGGWYTPYGSSYVSVGAPYGLFVRTLPGYTSSFYYGNTRYYYNDDTYYLYEPRRGGYVVSPSPYGDEDEAYEEDEDLYIYPAQAQSEQQQADDRYACHKWAVKESGYDPIDGEYDRDRRAGYLRAITACLTGRGYSVK